MLIDDLTILKTPKKSNLSPNDGSNISKFHEKKEVLKKLESGDLQAGDSFRRGGLDKVCTDSDALGSQQTLEPFQYEEKPQRSVPPTKRDTINLLDIRKAIEQTTPTSKHGYAEPINSFRSKILQKNKMLTKYQKFSRTKRGKTCS